MSGCDCFFKSAEDIINPGDRLARLDDFPRLGQKADNTASRAGRQMRIIKNFIFQTVAAAMLKG